MLISVLSAFIIHKVSVGFFVCVCYWEKSLKVPALFDQTIPLFDQNSNTILLELKTNVLHFNIFNM